MHISEVIAKLGGVAQAARAFGVKQPSVCGWIVRGRIPAGRAAHAAHLVGVDPHVLRPDIFPSPVGGPRAVLIGAKDGDQCR